MKRFMLAALSLVVLAPFAQAGSDLVVSATQMKGAPSPEGACVGWTQARLECMAAKTVIQQAGIDKSTQAILNYLESNKDSGAADSATYDKIKNKLVTANAKAKEAIELQCQVEGALEDNPGIVGREVTISCILEETTKRNAELERLVQTYVAR